MPNSFNEILGNENIKKYLQEIITNGKAPHSFIIDGQDGMGKKLLANVFAKTLQCEKQGINPCNECISCKTFDSKNNTDIFYLRPEGKKSIGVDEVRVEINKIVDIKPYRQKYKIFLIENSETLTVQAQNAILKTIEEPPDYAKFILLSNNYNLFLPTILSRCVLLKLKPLKIEQVKKYLVDKENISEEDGETFARFSGGNIGRAISFLKSEEFISLHATIINNLIKLKNLSMVEVFKLAKEMEVYKQNINEVLEIMFLWYRDVLVFKETSSDKFIFDKGNISRLKKESLELSTDSLYNSLESIEEAKISLRYNSNFQATLEVMLLKIKGFYN